MKGGTIVVDLDERVCELYHEEDMFFRRDIEPGVIMVRDAKDLHHWRVLAMLPEKR